MIRVASRQPEVDRQRRQPIGWGVKLLDLSALTETFRFSLHQLTSPLSIDGVSQ